MFEREMYREISIKDGLWLSYMNSCLPKFTKVKYKKKYPVIDFGFIISGYIKKCYENVSFENGWIDIKDSVSGIQFIKKQTGMFLVGAGRKQKILHLHMTIPFFQRIVRNDNNRLPDYFNNIAKMNFQKEFSFTQIMPPDVKSVVYQILNYLDNNSSWPFYLEGKILELISLQIVSFSGEQKNMNLWLNQVDKKKIYKARSFLVNDLFNPPTLRQICAHTGLSVNKLQTGFKALYGKTVFEYFREYRMYIAKSLLEKRESNVSETAWEVGYTNVSHFSEAFKKQFGVLPKQYLKKLRC